MDYLIWNEMPTMLGNLVGGLAFTGLTLYATHVKTAPKRASSSGAYGRLIEDTRASPDRVRPFLWPLDAT